MLQMYIISRTKGPIMRYLLRRWEWFSIIDSILFPVGQIAVLHFFYRQYTTVVCLLFFKQKQNGPLLSILKFISFQNSLFLTV